MATVKLSTLEAKHRSALLDHLNNFKSSNTLTDVTIVVNGNSFEAHKLILASCSEYFRAMFTDGMLESIKNVVNISGITSTGLSAILCYMYTSKLEITEDNVEDYLASGVYTQVSPVVDACTQFLKDNMDVENCTDLLTIAENYSLQEFRADVLSYISGSFDSVAATKEFYKLTPEQMESIVTGDVLMNITELEFLRYTLIWFLDQKETQSTLKLKHAESILKHIRFSDITPSQLHTMLDKFFSEKKLCKTHILYETIMNVSNKPENNLRVPLKFNKRGMDLAILKVGNGCGENVFFYFIDELHGRSLTVVPGKTRFDYATTVANNELYIVGDKQSDCPFEFKYNPHTNTWVKIDPMAVDRCQFTLTALNNKLYAVAGSPTIDEGDRLRFKTISSAECYDIDTDRWSSIKCLPKSRSLHAAVACTHSGRDMLYVSGGTHDGEAVASMFAYSVEKNKWTSCAPLLTPRARHFMMYYNNKIYVCGGWTNSTDIEDSDVVDMLTIDVYDVLKNKWSFLTNSPTGDSAVVGHETKIYFIGGFRDDGTDKIYNDNLVDCYDVLEHTWTRIEKEFYDYKFQKACVTLYIPKFRRPKP